MKEIKFIAKDRQTEILVPPPKPARLYTPKWFKDMPAFVGGTKQVQPFDSGRSKLNTSAKLCVPFSDTFNFGYIQETWCDIYVNNNQDGTADVFYSSFPELIEKRNKISVLPVEHFYQNEFAWKLQWIPQTPPGYSVLYTHPINHHHLPFHTLSGIVDSDEFIHERLGNHPLLINNGFEGFIPKGTPMFQIIPFKRDDWSSSAEEADPDQWIKGELLRQKFWGGYKKLFWKKKTFK